MFKNNTLEVKANEKCDDDYYHIDNNLEVKANEKCDDDYYNIDNDEIDKVIFTKENIEHFLLYQKSVELIGIVEKTELKNNLIKFNLVNKTGITIQVTVWDKVVREKIKSLMIVGSIIHIDGLFVNKKHFSLSSSNIDYDLTISTNTKFHMIKSTPMYTASNDKTNIVITNIEDSIKYTDRIQVIGWIKQKICQESLPNYKINQGCLSDCAKYKLEIRMPNLPDMSDFPVGSHVKVTGVIKHAAHPYLWVMNKDDVQLASNETKKLGDLLKGTCITKRVLTNNCTDNISKKIKY